VKLPSALLVAALLASLTAAPLATRAAEPLEVDFARDGSITLAAGALAAGLALWAGKLTPDGCRYCEPTRFDSSARTLLRWNDTGSAARASDLLANVVMPGTVVAHAVVLSWGDGGARQAGEDLLSVTEAVLLSVDLNQLVKSGVGRLRPSAWADGRLHGTESNRSFYSGHTALAFSLASAAGTVSTIRGYRTAPWVWAVGMSLAAGVGWLRVGADAHWVSDVLAGAVVGGAVGFAVPWTLHRPRGGKEPSVRLLPAPGGFALLF
jgi:membrane-associated phospholipid phosphatase